MTTIGVLCATDEERTALHELFGLGDEQPEGPFGVVSGEAEGRRLHVAQAGIGKAATAALTAHLATAWPDIELMVFCGVAGGLSPDLHPGDLVIGIETATHDYGALRERRLDWFPTGAVPIGNAPAPHYRQATVATPALERTIARFTADRSAPAVVPGRIISGDVFLNCRATRDVLQRAWAADAIDMESAAFVETAARFGKPVLVLRTLSDRACEESHLSYKEVAASAARNSAAFLRAYLRELGTPS